MSRKFIATILAAAVAVTGVAATPARADAKDVARALAAIATVAIIAKALDNSRDDRRVHDRHPDTKPPHVTHRPTPQPHVAHRPSTVHPRPLPDRVSSRMLPQQCLFTVNARHGAQRVFSKPCLTHTYRHAHSLPRACETQLRGKGPGREVYTAACLRDYGYTLARR